MTLRLDILPPAQRVFWDNLAPRVPPYFVLYGGTAVALRLGHRASVDFDFFTDLTLDVPALRAALPPLATAAVLQAGVDTLVVSLSMNGDPVKLSFFGGIRFGRVGDPERADNGLALASPIDLLATKLKTLHDRVEARDYVDIEALLRSGLTLAEGIAGAMALFGSALNPLDTAKAVAWFKDGGLEQRLSAATRSFLIEAAARFDPATTPLPIRSSSLA